MSTVGDIVNKFMTILQVQLFSEPVRELITKYYNIGMEEAELNFDMNFYRYPERLQLLEKHTFENIKGMNDEIADKLRAEMQRGFMNNESIDEMKERIQKVMNISIERAKMIASTEMHRAENMGHIDGARQSELKLVKKWSAQRERISRAGNMVPCPICEALDGTTIALDDKFIAINGAMYDNPPVHPHCACTLEFIQVRGKEDDS